MSVKKISIAIISDLHCHHSDNDCNDTYLTSDRLRTPVDDHPVESLLKLIEVDKLKTDLTLCPGDFTNKSDRQGFISGWDFVNEIHASLKGDEIIATLGNHDVDSYEKVSSYNLEIAKGIKKNFPLKKDKDRDTFWSKGCVFVEKDNYRVLVINSSHFHYNKSQAKGGKVDSNLLDYVSEYLEKQLDNKIFITLAHHHPIDHSRINLGENDKIINGSELLEILGKNGCDLFVHGHKHDPLLRYHPLTETSGRIAILSSGSFSATTNHSWTGKRNNFHMINIEKTDKGECLGRISTWTFMPRSGWKILQDDGGFHSYTGFGNKKNIRDLANQIIKEVGTSVSYKWEEIVLAIPEVNYLIPVEAEELTKILVDSNFIISPKISECPKIISNLSYL